MTTSYWRGDCQPRPQVTKITPSSPEIGDIFTLTINRKDISITADQASIPRVCQQLAAAITASDIPEFMEVTTAYFLEDPIDPTLITALKLIGPADGKPFTVTSSTTEGGIGITITETVKGDAGRNEKQRITLSGNPTGGTFTLSFNGQTTGTIAYNASAFTVRDALCDLSTIAGTDEVQTITITGTPTGGDFTLTYAGQTTAAIAFDANAAAVQSALEALSNIAAGDVVCAGGDLPGTPVTVTFKANLGRQNVALMTDDDSGLSGGSSPEVTVTTSTPGVASEVTVTGSAGGPWTVEFVEALANTDVPLITGNGGSLAYGAGAHTVNVTTVQNGGGRYNQIQLIDLTSGENPASLSGTFTLTFDGQTTGNIAAGASAATVQSELEGLSNLGSGDVVVRTTGLNGTQLPPNGVPAASTFGYSVEFSGAYAGVDAPLLIGDGSSLDGIAAVGVQTIQNGLPYTPCKINVRISLGSWTFTLRHPVTGLLTTSAPMSSTAAASVVKSTLGAMVGYTAADFDVTRNGGGPGYASEYIISFVGSIGGQDLEIWESGNTTTPGLIFAGSNQTITELQDGSDDPTNEQQYLFWTAGRKATGGTFTLTLQGETTGNIAYDAAASAVQTALEGLSNVGAGNVEVTGTTGGPWTVEFTGDLAGIGLNQMTVTNTNLTGQQIFVTVWQAANAGNNEIQTVTLGGGPSGGTFTLTFSGQTTGTIAYNATAATVQAALVALSNIAAGEVAVSGDDGGPWTVVFQVGLGGTNQPAMTGDASSLSGGSVDVSTIQVAVLVTNELQTVTIEEATGGTFTLTYSGQTTDALAYNAAASTVETSLAALSSVGPGNIAVTGAAGGPYSVEFRGTLGGTDVAAMTADASSLTGEGTQDLVTSEDTAPTGPNWWNEPENWSANAAPANSDTLIVENSDSPILYGLASLPSITPTLLRIKASMEAAIGLPQIAQTDNGDYFEYRPQYLICKAAKVIVGEGDGDGCPIFKLDTSTAQTEVIVMSTGRPDDPNVPAMLWIGTHADSVIRIFRGTVGLAFLAGETAQIATLQIGYRDDQDSDAEVATGVGLTVATVQKSGGDLRMATASGSTVAITTTAGLLIIDGEGAVSQLTIRGGDVKYNTTGTLGGNTVVCGDGWLDFSQDMRSKTVTNAIEKYDDTSRITDPFQTVNTSGNFVIDCNHSALVGIDIGRNRRVTCAAVA